MKSRIVIPLIFLVAFLLVYIEEYIRNHLRNWLIITCNIPNVAVLGISDYLKVIRKEKGELKLRKKEFILILFSYILIGLCNSCIAISLKNDYLLLVAILSIAIILYEILDYSGFKFKGKQSQEEIDEENDKTTNDLIESIKSQKDKFIKN